MVVKIKAAEMIVATCYGSKILGLSDIQEADLFLDSYQRLFPDAEIVKPK